MTGARLAPAGGRRVVAIALALLAAAPARAAEVQGRVLHVGDAAPVDDASILLPDGAVIPVGRDGRFTLTVPDDVEITLQVTSDTLRAATLTLTPPVTEPVLVWLRDSALPGEIVVEAFRPTADLSRHHVDAEMAYETPGTYDDAVRLVQSLPGVVVQREYSPGSGDVTVRGSQPGDSRFYLDGIEVPYLYHFNQYASVFPASQLADLELFPSTFGSRYGDAVGAVIEARSKEDRPDDVTGSVGVNMVMLSGELRAPLPKRWWIGASARRSFQDVINRGSEQYPVWPQFYDLSARAVHDGPKGDVGVFVAAAGDRYDRTVGELDLLDPVDVGRAPTLTYRRDWQLLGVTWKSRLGRLASAVLHDRLQADVDVGGGQDVRTLGLPTRLDLEVPVGDYGLKVDAGAELRPELAWIDVADAGDYGVLVSREAPALAWGVSASQRQLRLRAAGYATLHAVIGRARLMPGVRVGLDTLGLAGTVEPRFAARLRLADTTELRGAIGRYLQRPDTADLVALGPLPTTSAWQLGVGLDHAFSGRLELSLDGYVKALRDVRVQPARGAPLLFDQGRAYGAELTMRYRLRETFFLWGWLSYSRSQVRDAASWTSTAADQPWAGGVVASWNILPQLNLALRYRAASGLPFTQLEGSTYDATADTWVPEEGALNAERLPFYQKIDVHLAYTFRFRRWSLSAALDVWIVPKSSAQLYPTWSYDYREQGWVLGPQVLPLIGVRATF